MKTIPLFTSLTLAGVLFIAGGAGGHAQTNRPPQSGVPPGFENAARDLPPGVPRMVDTNGDLSYLDMKFTTQAYQQAAFNLVLREANQVAKDMHLPEELPITKSNVLQGFISPFGISYVQKCIGNISTKNYVYCVSVGNKFSYLEGTHQAEDCKRYAAAYMWPVSKIDTNLAYQQATQWLRAAHMDVAGLDRDCRMGSRTGDFYYYTPPGKFVPVYEVYWEGKTDKRNTVAEVMVFTPTKALLQLRVEDAKYILREPLGFTNLAALFPGVAPVITNHVIYGGVVTPSLLEK
jgi:hypothetical protein